MTEAQTTEDAGQQRTMNSAWGDHVVCYRPGRWVLALLLGVPLAVAGAAAVYFTYQEMFKASAWLEIKADSPYIIHNVGNQSRQFQVTQTQLISSPLVLGEVLYDPDVKDLAELKEARDDGVDPLDWIREGLSVDAVGRDSELYTISFTSPEPQNAALVANAVTKAYYNDWRQRDVQRTQRVIELLEEAREKQSTDVERLRNDVRRMSKEAIGVDPYAAPSERTVELNDPLAELRTRLINAEVERQMLELEIAAFQEMIDQGASHLPADFELIADYVNNDPQAAAPPAGPDQPTSRPGNRPSRRPYSPYRPARPAISPWFDLYRQENASLGPYRAENASQRDGAPLDALVEDRVENDGFVLAIKQLINEKRLRLFEAETTGLAANNEQQVRQLTAELKAAEEKLDTVRRELQLQVAAQIKEAASRKRKLALAGLLSRKDSVVRMEELLRKRYKEEFVKKKQYSGETVELAFQRAELARAEQALDMIATRAAALRTEQNALPRVEPLHGAMVPGSPVEEFPIWRLTWVALAGLFLPSVLLAIWRTAAWLGCRSRNRTGPQAA